jgi:hypothetical protein
MKNLFEVLKEWERQGRPEGSFYSYSCTEGENKIVTFPMEALICGIDTSSLFLDLHPTEYIPPKETWVETNYPTIALMNLFGGDEVECQYLKDDTKFWQSPDEIKVKDLKHYKWRWKEKRGALSKEEWDEKIKRTEKYN